MGDDPEKYNRHSIRMKGYDYSLPGAYFVTLISFHTEYLFGEVKNGELLQSDIGGLIKDCWMGLPIFFEHIRLDEQVLMPNHLHGIIIIDTALGKGEAFSDIEPIEVEAESENASPLRPRGTQPGLLGAIIQNFKSVSTRMANKRYFEPGNKIWQRDYYERIIRNERELNAIRQYIRDNPLNWDLDSENPMR
jgi:REP element-mobilizing transposase RayT